MTTQDDILRLSKSYADKNTALAESLQKAILLLVQKYYIKISVISENAKLINGELPKKLQTKIGSLLSEMNAQIETLVTESTVKAWIMSEQKGAEIEAVVHDAPKPQKFPIYEVVDEAYPIIARRYGGGSAEALKTFIERAEDGMNLSQRIYKQGEAYQSFIEGTLKKGIGSGTSARDLSEKLINVIDANAQGQGVYKDPKKNTFRLARNEINTAYRTADYYRNRDEWFVVGIEIHLSNRDREIDICDELTGEYPKDFIFKGWHVNCRCFTVPKLASKEEIKAQDDYDLGRSKTKPDIKYINDIPQAAKDYVAANMKTFEKWKTMPWFISDNQDYFQ